jgi:molecular chaperone HtpG
MTTSVAPEESKEIRGFQTEIKQLLDILVHSLYSQREIFLRELISNASDALHRVKFEMLTNRDVLDPDAKLAIRIIGDPEKGTLTISDTGVGMTHDELVENLGVIAHSGAAQFIKALQEQQGSPEAIDQIGQFGVGFYSVFMVADEVRVTSRSYLPEERAWTWVSSGDDAYELMPAEKSDRGTTIEIALKKDAQEFAEDWRIKSIIHKYSDFITFPITVNDESEPVNRQQAIWRQSPSQVSDEEANEFYKQLTLAFEDPLTRIHVQTDAPVQIYALLYIPARLDRTLLGLKQDYGLRLYSRQIRIQDHNKELLPDYLRFIEGVVDSEDIPLNVSREMVQSSRVLSKIKSVLTRKALNTLSEMAQKDPEKYQRFWQEFGVFIKEGITTDYKDHEKLIPLLRFYSTKSEEEPISLADYIARAKPDQKIIYYITGESLAAMKRSPHLEYFRREEIEALYFDQPVDAFLPQSIGKYEEFEFQNVDRADVKASDEADAETPEPGEDFEKLAARAKEVLGEKIVDVRPSRILVSAPARLSAPEGVIDTGIQRVRRLMEEDYTAPQMVLELNPSHPIVTNLMQRAAAGEPDEIADAAIEQLYEDALLLEGFHPDPAQMVARIQKLLEAATRE